MEKFGTGSELEYLVSGQNADAMTRNQECTKFLLGNVREDVTTFEKCAQTRMHCWDARPALHQSHKGKYGKTFLTFMKFDL